jgi:acyl-CoA reductase-like NAD-dependent aldehyde dehydrogenase
MDLPLYFPLHVAGKAFDDGRRVAVRDPWRGEVVGEVVLCDEPRAELATRAAERAFTAMRRLPAFERRRILKTIAQSVAWNAEKFAELIAREAGKPLKLAHAEVARAVSTLELGAEEATRVGGEVLPLDLTETAAGMVGGYTRVPAGPVIAMTPFNFPLNLACHKLAPAFACGCPVVLKPPPQAPLTSLLLGDLVNESGAPEGAFQVVPCEVPIAERLVRDERFATLSFTGSARVGWHLQTIARKKRVLLELGGNAAVIVHGDADVERAVEKVVRSAFDYAGHVCIKAQRLFVHESVYDAVVAELVGRAAAIVPRDPLDLAAIVSCLIDEASAIRVENWIAEARDAGAERLAGEKRDGSRMGPTLIAVTSPDHLRLKVVAEEVFGPVLTIHKYAAFADAIEQAGATRYGLQAALFTKDLARVREAFDGLRVGGLIVNESPSFRVDAMPYGGSKDSGLGREGVRFAIDEMTERKLLAIRI